MTLSLRNVQLDVPADVHAAVVAFWATALHARPRPSPADDTYVHLHDAAAVVPVHVQRLDTGPARVHLDLAAGDPSAPGDVDTEVARLTDLGAEVAGRSDAGWVTVRTPGGLLACVVPGAAPPTPVAPPPTPVTAATDHPDTAHPRLTGVFADVAPADATGAAGFWAAALGGTVRRDPHPDGAAYTAVDGIAAAGGPVTFEVQAVDAAPRYHLDISATDVAAEAERLEAAGATRVAEVATWITLADPAGILFCVVPATGGHDGGSTTDGDDESGTT